MEKISVFIIEAGRREYEKCANWQKDEELGWRLFW